MNNSSSKNERRNIFSSCNYCPGAKERTSLLGVQPNKEIRKLAH
jgi:hypothetical protein